LNGQRECLRHPPPICRGKGCSCAASWGCPPHQRWRGSGEGARRQGAGLRPGRSGRHPGRRSGRAGWDRTPPQPAAAHRPGRPGTPHRGVRPGLGWGHSGSVRGCRAGHGQWHRPDARGPRCQHRGAATSTAAPVGGADCRPRRRCRTGRGRPAAARPGVDPQARHRRGRRRWCWLGRPGPGRCCRRPRGAAGWQTPPQPGNRGGPAGPGSDPAGNRGERRRRRAGWRKPGSGARCSSPGGLRRAPQGWASSTRSGLAWPWCCQMRRSSCCTSVA
jgi:translation initiation factor IF-2